MYDPDDCLMISGLQHFRFCRRQWALIHIEQQWAENLRTTEGALLPQITFVLGAFSGCMAAISRALFPRSSVSVSLFSVTPVILTLLPGLLLSPSTKLKQLK